MKIIALGTGTSQGVPVIGCNCTVCGSSDLDDTRLRSSVYIQTPQTSILIDIGPDFRTQFLNNKIKTVDSVLITHEHNDHVIGLDDIRAINFTQRKDIPFYASDRVVGVLKSRFSYAFSDDKYPGLPKVGLNTITDVPFELCDVTVTPINVMHGTLPIFGYRLNDLAYITDANYISDKELSKLYGVKVLIINALRHASHYSHFSLPEALAVAKKINADKTYLTHISHMMGPTSEWKKDLPSNVSPLQDKMVIEI